MKQVPEEIQHLLKEVINHFDKEDVSVRERQIRTWRRLKLFWEGFQKAWYSEVAHDWRIWNEGSSDNTDQSYYDKPINVFRAYLESIIAALSITVPAIKCFPDNADNTLDLSTAKAGDKIAQLVYRHNDVALLWLHALFIYCTEGMVACYSYPKADKKYGTYDEKKYEDSIEEHELTNCSNCGYNIEDRQVQPGEPPLQQNQPELPEDLENQERDEFGPDNEDIKLQDALLNKNKELCPACMVQMDPEIKREQFVVTRLIGVTTQPKTRICLEAYGGLYVKIPNYAKKQEDCPYLIFSYETHYSNAIERFEHLHGKDSLTAQKISSSVGPRDPYEQWGRLSPQYQGEYPINNVTIRNTWLRRSAFNVLNIEDAKTLKKLFPNGAKVVLVNDEFGEACNEALDDCWTIEVNPLSDYLHYDPSGLLLVSIQEITNDIISLIVQTVEHGIGQTFADPTVLNFNAYRQMESVPGGIYEATPKSGKSIGDAFYEIKTANLSPEIMPFLNNIQSLGQLVSGALPSLFGGALEGSETASQYSMSRSQALQRLQNVWKVKTIWWKQIFGKVIPMFIKEMKDDENDVKRDKDGNFINTFIRRAELEGKIGKVELEANENLPLTWSQISDKLDKLFQNANPEVMKMIATPENIPLIHEYLGLTDFYVPGEDDTIKQYDEIKLLLNSEPIQQPPDPIMVQQALEMGQPPPPMQEVSSIEIDPIFDNHAIEFEICRKWIISEAGRQAKIDNEAGYRNVLLHGKLHFMQIQQSMTLQNEKGVAPSAKSTQLDLQKTPIEGEVNVSTIQ